MRRQYRVSTIRLLEEQAAAFEAVAGFRGESFNTAVISAMKALIREMFSKEIEAGEDLLLRAMPKPIRLSDVCEAFEIEFPAV